MEKRDLHKRLAAFAAAVMMTGSAVVAAPYILDDFENTDKGADVMNYNNGAWYLYDDRAPSWDKKTFDKAANKYTDPKGMLAGGDSKFTKMNDTEITDADMKEKITKNADGDILKQEKIYPNVTATDGAGADNSRGLKVEFMLGATLPSWGHEADQNYDGFVGLGTGLVPEGKWQPLSGETVVSFKAKADWSEDAELLGADHVAVDFTIQTNQYVIKLHGNTYKVKCKLTKDWQTFSYKLEFGKDTDPEKTPETKFYQHNWWHEYESDPLEDEFWGWESAKEDFVALIEEDPKWEQSEKLQWVIKNPVSATTLPNGALKEEAVTLYLDDVTIENYTPLFDDEIPGEKAWANNPIDPEKDLKVYDNGNANTIGDGNGWYTYDDTKNDDGTPGNGTSKIDETFITEAGENVGIKFTLGDTFKKEIEGKEVQIFPFVGLAVGMYSDPANETGDYDYTKGGSENPYNGIQFKYKTVGEKINWIQVRMKDNQKLKADGASFNVKVPGTGGEWKTATVALADLKLPWWDDKDPGVVLNTKAGRTIEFAYEGKPADAGELYVDDLYLVTDAVANTPDITPVTKKIATTKSANFGLTLNSNAINLRLPVGVSKAQVMLYNVRGQLVSSQIVENGISDAVISTENLATNTYIVRAVSLEGAAANFAKAISIVR